MFRRYPRGRVLSVAIVVGFALAVAAPAAQQTATPAAPQANLPTAAAIIARHVQGIGGEAAFKAVRSFRAAGTLEIPSQQLKGQVELVAARPNKGIVRASIEGIGRTEEGFDGKVGWSIDPISGPSLVSGPELAQRADDAWFDATLHGADYVREMTVLGRETFDRRPAYKLKIVKLSGFESTEYFDVETGLQIGEESTQHSAMGSIPVTSIFREYATHGAVKLPAVLVQRTLGIEQVLTMTSYEIDKVPASAFDLPPVIKALIKK